MRQLPLDNRRPLTGPAPVAPVAADGAASQTISLGHFIGVVRRRWRLILGLAVVGAILGGVLGARTPPSYRAVAMLRVAYDRQVMTGDIEAAPPTPGRNMDPILSTIQLIRSRNVMGAVVDSLGLQLKSGTPDFPIRLVSDIRVDPRMSGDSIQLRFYQNGVLAKLGPQERRAAYGNPMDFGRVRFTVASAPEVSTAVLGVAPREAAIDGLSSGLEITTRTNTDIIDLSYTAADPNTAQRMVNTTARSFESMNVLGARAKSRRRREFLADQLSQTDSMLALAQAQLSSFRSRQLLANSRDKLAAQQQQLMALEMRQAELQADRNTFGTLMKRLKSSNEAERSEALRALATSPAIGDSPSVGPLYQQLTSYQNLVDSLTSGPYPSAATNPDVLHYKSLIKSTSDNLVGTVGSYLRSLDARIGSLGGLRARNASSIEVLPAMAEEEARLTHKVEALSGMGDQLRQDFQKARISEAVEAGDVEIVDLAGRPYAPLLATAALKLAVGLLLGFMLGLGGAFMLEAANTSIRRPEDLELMLHVPGLAVIPRLSTQAQVGRSRLAGLIGGGPKNSAAASRSAGLGALSQPFSVGTEAFRMLRTSLIWSDPGDQLRSLVVTSAGPGEGKTLTAANLAVTFAYDGMRVLLVDCDVRRPRLHGLFRVPRSPGLMELLMNRNGNGGPDTHSLSLDPDALASNDPTAVVIRPTSVKGLSLLTCGALPTNASNLLSGARMRVLMEQLSKNFDLIILDTPPVLATADAGILSSLTDGVLLVVRAGQTDRAAAQRAHHLLANVGARIVGTVLNDPGGEVSQYGDYYYPYDYAVEQE
jgi:succinoglycan biosynthesis transport protein ExoP